MENNGFGDGQASWRSLALTMNAKRRITAAPTCDCGPVRTNEQLTPMPSWHEYLDKHGERV